MKAMLIGINWETGDVKHQEAVSIRQGRGLEHSVSGDFPGYEWFVFGDEQARAMHAADVARETETPNEPTPCECAECNCTNYAEEGNADHECYECQSGNHCDDDLEVSGES